jgi:hypothetical protein
MADFRVAMSQPYMTWGMELSIRIPHASAGRSSLSRRQIPLASWGWNSSHPPTGAQSTSSGERCTDSPLDPVARRDSLRPMGVDRDYFVPPPTGVEF